MARIKYGSLVTEISGSIGGSTFQKSAYGSTLRNKPNPVRSTSAPQLLVRQYMKQAHAAWRDLTAAERLQWQQFTSYSNPKIRHDHSVTMSGHALYLKYQVSRLMAGLAIQDTLSYIAMPTWYYPSVILQDAPNLYLDTNAPPETPFTNMFVIFLISTPRPASRRFSQAGIRFCNIVDAGDWDTLTFHTAYVANFGANPANGSWLHYTYQVFSSLTPIFSNIRKGVIEVQAL